MSFAGRLGALVLVACSVFVDISLAAPTEPRDVHIRVELPADSPPGIDPAALQKAIDAYLSDFSHEFAATASTTAPRPVDVIVSWGNERQVSVVVKDASDPKAEALSFDLAYSEPVEPSFYRSVALKVRSTISVLLLRGDEQPKPPPEPPPKPPPPARAPPRVVRAEPAPQPRPVRFGIDAIGAAYLPLGERPFGLAFGPGFRIDTAFWWAGSSMTFALPEEKTSSTGSGRTNAFRVMGGGGYRVLPSSPNPPSSLWVNVEAGVLSLRTKATLDETGESKNEAQLLPLIGVAGHGRLEIFDRAAISIGPRIEFLPTSSEVLVRGERVYSTDRFSGAIEARLHLLL